MIEWPAVAATVTARVNEHGVAFAHTPESEPVADANTTSDSGMQTPADASQMVLAHSVSREHPRHVLAASSQTGVGFVH